MYMGVLCDENVIQSMKSFPFRREWKFICAEASLNAVEQKLSAVLNLDSHTESGSSYSIHSLYFDDYTDSSMRGNDAGSFRKDKYRIRYYRNDPKTLHLEKKCRRGERSGKLSYRLTEEECLLLAEGQFENIFWRAEDPMLREFCACGMSRLMRPKAIIDYERTAYVDELLHIRITFDRNITASDDTGSFLTQDYQRYPVMSGRQHILEVKFDSVLPRYLKSILSSEELERTAFSKYYMGRKVCQAQKGI